MGVVTPADVTPNAVNWPDSLNNSVTQRTTIGQQITGIASPITLKVNSADGNLYSWQYAINSTDSTPDAESPLWTTILFANAPPYLGDTETFTVSNNDWLFFRYTVITVDLCSLWTASVINVSDNNAVLDTWQAQLRPRNGSC
jgi:hypothetical protein